MLMVVEIFPKTLLHNFHCITIITEKFALKERILRFVQELTLFCKNLPSDSSNTQYVAQTFNSAEAIGFYYGKAIKISAEKYQVAYLKVSYREAKYIISWLELLIFFNEEKYSLEGEKLLREANELKKILSSIIIEMRKG